MDGSADHPDHGRDQSFHYGKYGQHVRSMISSYFAGSASCMVFSRFLFSELFFSLDHVGDFADILRLPQDRKALDLMRH